MRRETLHNLKISEFDSDFFEHKYYLNINFEATIYYLLNSSHHFI